MLYALICNDKPGTRELRDHYRPAHQLYLADLRDRGILKMAGPLLDDREEPEGSLLIVEVGSRAAAQELLDEAPYTSNGVFGDVEIRPFRWVFNPPGE